MTERSIIDGVRNRYASVAKGQLSNESTSARAITAAFGYSDDKPVVFREIVRVLKPAGRVAMSDIALSQPLPTEVKQSVEAYVGCISGAVLIEDYRSLLEQAGFASVIVTDTRANLNAHAMANDGGCCGGGACGSDTTTQQQSLHGGLTSVMQSLANAYAASVRVHALKQTSTQTI